MNKDNLKLWNSLKQPPITALKKIEKGRLAGKSDINPQWRMGAITEVFGACGQGWKYTIDKLWIEEAGGIEKASFALITFNYLISKDGGNIFWSEDIPGIGGSKLVAQEKMGPHTNDECYKMAVTDALSVAFKSIGVAADIYLGNFDGSKYKDQPKDAVQPQQEPIQRGIDKGGKYNSQANKDTFAEGVVKKVMVDEVEGTDDIIQRLRDSNVSDTKKMMHEKNYRAKIPELRKMYAITIEDEIKQAEGQIPLM